MKRNVSILLLLIVGIVGVCIFLSSNTPDERDFVQWFEENYDITCHDNDCSVIDKKLEDDGESKETRLVRSEGYYSPGTFTMKMKRLYRGEEDQGDIFSIEVEGFNGNFEVIEESETIG
ncbi:hypothetical protein ACFQ3N_18695 [Virgibacillus byunsanensis]|uniref:DUF5640 domain-containing protein n=1 Tax=Virgibacillus byunsanensis TaxID=570945 RepID=A0ABW3LST4_9BACI